MASTQNSWDTMARPAYNPFAMQLPQTADIEKAMSMRAFILNSGVTPGEIEALAEAKKAGADVIKALRDATPKDPRDQKIDSLTAEVRDLKDALKALTDKNRGPKNADH